MLSFFKLIFGWIHNSLIKSCFKKGFCQNVNCIVSEFDKIVYKELNFNI